MITTVKEFNEDQEKQYQEYCEKCHKNNVPTMPFSRYFTKFDYKQGFVAWGKYPIYKRRKKDLM